MELGRQQHMLSSEPMLKLTDFRKKALFAPSVVGKCSFIGHKLRFAA